MDHDRCRVDFCRRVYALCLMGCLFPPRQRVQLPASFSHKHFRHFTNRADRRNFSMGIYRFRKHHPLFGRICVPGQQIPENIKYLRRSDHRPLSFCLSAFDFCLSARICILAGLSAGHGKPGRAQGDSGILRGGILHGGSGCIHPDAGAAGRDSDQSDWQHNRAEPPAVCHGTKRVRVKESSNPE